MANTTTVLTNKAELTYTSDKVKGDGYYGYADGLHTMSFHFKNFAGRIYVQATLVAEPTESDWFNIQLRSSADYYEYTTQTTGTLGSTFQGNFVWIRVKIDRSTLGAATYDSALHGLFDKAVLLI
jgi:hypothetical protein|tara:strand:+ start:3221 stop:3595 length:375 start_codon:yes stop_codon:yes gene_type:complete